jgi:hypothetical protein
VPRLSIVIPWVGPAGPFEDTLASVLQNRPAGAEVIVALERSYDDPHGLAEEVAFLPPAGPSATTGIVPLVNRGVRAAAAPIVHVVPCGYQVSDGWAGAALLHFDDPDIGAVASVLLDQKRQTRVIAAGIDPGRAGTARPSQRGTKYSVARLATTSPAGATLAGGFFRTPLLTALGGFDESLAMAQAELDLALCFAELGLRTECEPTSVLVAAGSQPSRQGSFGEGRAAEAVFRRHGAGAFPGPRWAQLAAEAAWTLAQPWWLAHGCGRVAALLDGKHHERHAARIARARAALEGACDEGAVVKMPLRRQAQPADQRRRAA